MKTENGIDKTVYQMWNSFTESNPEYKDSEMPESWYFHNNEEDANRLAELVAKGKKKAVDALVFECNKCKEKILVTKKMK